MSCVLSPSFVSNHTRKESRGRRIQDDSRPYLLPSRNWGVELRRRDQDITSRGSESTIPTSGCHSGTSLPSLTLPSSPIIPRLSPGPYGRPSIVTPRHRDPHPDSPSSNELDRLRLDALTELQKSVVEKGEGFVDKMRDWETHRAMSNRGLKRSNSVVTRRTPDPTDDSDDVMVLDSASDEASYFWEPPRKKRAFSAGVADTLGVASPKTTLALVDDDTKSCVHPTSALPPPFPNTPSYPDKAVSALTLAFASGLCGISDYQAVLDAHNHTHYGEESHIGELWD